MRAGEVHGNRVEIPALGEDVDIGHTAPDGRKTVEVVETNAELLPGKKLPASGADSGVHKTPVIGNSCDGEKKFQTSNQNVERQTASCTPKMEHEKSALLAASYVKGGNGGDTHGPQIVVARQRSGVEGKRIRLRIASKKQMLNRDTTGEKSDLVVSPRGESSGENVSNRDKQPLSLGSRGDMGAIQNTREGERDDMSAPKSASLCRVGGNQPVKENCSGEDAPRYQLPSLEERLRLIREERAERLDKMQEKYAAAMADTVAPRPKTLTRIRYGATQTLRGLPERHEDGRRLALENGPRSDLHLDRSSEVGSRTSPVQHEVFPVSSSAVVHHVELCKPKHQQEQHQQKRCSRQEFSDGVGFEFPLGIDRDD